MFKVDFYKDKSGNKPIRELIEKLLDSAKTNKEDRVRVKKVLAYIQALERWERGQVCHI